MALIDPTYQRDAYLAELETEVVEIGRDGERFFAVTADTVFYPEGGGQPADRGSLGGIEVIDVQKIDGIIRHFLNDELALGPVHQVLDWRRRLDHMQQHTGQHLLTAVALGRFGWATTAFHMGPIMCDIELDVASLTDDDLRRLEDAVAEEIRAARPVTVRYARMEEMEALGVRSRLLPEGLSGKIRLVGSRASTSIPVAAPMFARRQKSARWPSSAPRPCAAGPDSFLPRATGFAGGLLRTRRGTCSFVDSSTPRMTIYPNSSS